jgi:hypothetical protein
MGIPLMQTAGTNAAEQRVIEYDYPLAAARAFTGAAGDRPFRFIYTSGRLAERDASRSLWLAASSRHLKVHPPSIFLPA